MQSLVIGVTGKIASGKSAVSRLLAKRGLTVINGDALGHKSYAPGGPAYSKLVECFGTEVLDSTGAVNRKTLGAIVFNSSEKMQQLNGIVWPEIRKLLVSEITQSREKDHTKSVVVEAALLFAAGWDDLCDRIWFVEASQAVVIERLMQRSQLNQQEALARWNSQSFSKQDFAKVNVFLKNEANMAELEAAVDAHIAPCIS